MRVGIPLYFTDRKTGSNTGLTMKNSYQSSILSLIKKGLKESNPEAFEKYYGSQIMKNFALSLFFPNATFDRQYIHLGTDKNGILFFSTNDIQTFYTYLNAFHWLRDHSSVTDNNGKKHKLHFSKYHNVMVGREFDVQMPLITSHKAIFKTSSPICIHTSDNYYLSCQGDKMEDGFNDAVRSTIKAHQKTEYMRKLAEQVNFKPIKMRKTVMKSFDIATECSSGIFELEADPAILNDVMQNGLGNKRGQCAGLITLVKEVKD